ncbi:MAG: hypothetical protein HCA25_08210 [Dolichospermum sp. DET50]|nr:hypothetical protein [Dolichospermum sp. DET50]
MDNVKICDPAIGSGAFPMGLLHEIFTAKQTLHTFEFGNTTKFNASGVKLNIIQNSFQSRYIRTNILLLPFYL